MCHRAPTGYVFSSFSISIDKRSWNGTEIEAKPWRTPRSINFLYSITLPVSWRLVSSHSLTFQHKIQYDTPRQFQHARPCSAATGDWTTTGWKPEHDTSLVGGDRNVNITHWILSAAAKQSVPQESSYRITLHSSQYVICHCTQSAGIEG
jgi:hypothetical protein